MNNEKYNSAFNYFKKSYTKKMGGTQTVALPNGKEKYFDDREYYTGRGSKYNSDSMHNNYGTIKVSRKDYSLFLAKYKKAVDDAKAFEKQKEEKRKRVEEAEQEGVYSFVPDKEGGFNLELSDLEYLNNEFDAVRLAKTLDIRVEDALLLKSQGKTYVFAESKSGKVYMLYHSSLIAGNNLSIYFEEANKGMYEKFIKERNLWVEAPFAREVGQTTKSNHFVC